LSNTGTRSLITFVAQAAALALAAQLGAARLALAQQQGGTVNKSQGTSAITGRVTAQSTGQPLVGATVSVSPTGAGAFTDEQGRFQIDVPPGKYSLEVSLAGHAPQIKEVDVSDKPADVAFTLRDDARYAETIVIVGSRTPRSVTKSPVPIDVITSEQIQEVGQVETNQILRTVAPSYNATHQMISDGTDHINPASLRGLGPDQTLVLLNGKRYHTSALVNVNGTFGRGTVGTDLNSIPTSAIERIEVLRDGAAAQYGSDAIAGVVNVVLKEAPGVVEASALSGLTASGDGFELKTGLNYGVPVGDLGVVNVTGEFIQRNPTNRGGAYTGTFYPGSMTAADDDAKLAAAGLSRDDVALDLGQSQASVGMLFYNTRIPMGSNEVYSTGGVTYRKSSAAGFYRRPNQPGRVVTDVYPDGFLPKIEPTIFDWSVSAGVRTDRESEGFRWDVSANHGGNWFDYHIADSLNASFEGTQSPTDFDAGGFMYNMSSLNADVVMPIRTDALKKLALNAGAEYRLENYSIHAGDQASWDFYGRTYPSTDMMGNPIQVAAEAGAQVFPGFQPANEVDEFRNSEAGYVGAETEFNDRILLDVAGRFENYEDFGSTVNGKIAARVSLIDQFALRVAGSTGFRAPSLHQSFFNNISTQFVPDPTMGGALVGRQVYTARNDSDIAAAFGVPELKEETSVNASGGMTLTPVENFSITADGYFIDIDNRIVLTSQFNEGSAPGTNGILDPLTGNVTAAQFFSNAVDTRTWGTDVVVDFWSDVGAGRLGLTGAGNVTRTRVLRVNVPQSVADKFAAGNLGMVQSVYFSREEEGRLEESLPREKGLIQGRYSQGPVAGLLRANYWGKVTYRGLDPTGANDEEFGAKVTLDADIGYQLTSGFKVAIGGDNILNQFPDEQTKAPNITDGQFKYSRRVQQFGVNGAFYYLRLQYLY